MGRVDIFRHTLPNNPAWTVVFLLISASVWPCFGVRWLGLSTISSVGSVEHLSPVESQCEMLRGTLAQQQIKFCKKYPSFMGPVKAGALSAINECQSQFRYRRWNCSTSMELDKNIVSQKINAALEAEKLANRKSERSASSTSSAKSAKSVTSVSSRHIQLSTRNLTQSDQPQPAVPNASDKGKMKRRRENPLDVMGPFPIVPTGTREAAFVHAISAAGVAHALTRACSGGMLHDCGCDRSVKGLSTDGFQWSGCSDNIAYGTGLTKLFVDAKEARGLRKWRKKSMMNIHNNEAGRRVLEQSMMIECKCHGVSGSCELKTCWKRMPKFHEIGEKLKHKFERATRVKRRKIGGRFMLVGRSNEIRPYSKSDLVYLKKSPSFCEFDIGHKGISLGTSQRQCNATSHGLDGCDTLCCGRGFRTQRVKRIQQCNCKFTWCCTVKCDQCVTETDIHTCL